MWRTEQTFTFWSQLTFLPSLSLSDILLYVYSFPSALSTWIYALFTAVSLAEWVSTTICRDWGLCKEGIGKTPAEWGHGGCQISPDPVMNLEDLLLSDYLQGAQAFLVGSLWCSLTSCFPKALNVSIPCGLCTWANEAFGPWPWPGSWVPVKSSLNLCSECSCFWTS